MTEPYIVKPGDLIGCLAEYPIEVVQRVMDLNFQQDRHETLEDYQKYGIATGFIWDKSPEGYDFWNDLDNTKDTTRFFELYPKKEIIFQKPSIFHSIENSDFQIFQKPKLSIFK